MVSAICSRSSSSPRANGCWMCPRRSRRGCGCWGRADRTRPTRTTAIRSRSRRGTHRSSRVSRAADHAAVLRLLAKRNKELGSARTRTACRLHALLVELVPGGISKQITANRAAALLASVTPASPVEATRHTLALEHLEDLRRIDEQMRASKRRISDAVEASRTSSIDIFGIGPVGATIAVGQTHDISRFENRDRFAAYNGTAPIEVGSGEHHVHRLSRRGNRQLESRDPHGRDHPDPPRALTWPRLLRPQARRGQDEEGSAPSVEATHQRRALPTTRRRRRREDGSGTANGDDSTSQRDRPHTPTAGASEQPIPDPRQA